MKWKEVEFHLPFHPGLHFSILHSFGLNWFILRGTFFGSGIYLIVNGVVKTFFPTIEKVVIYNLAGKYRGCGMAEQTNCSVNISRVLIDFLFLHFQKHCNSAQPRPAYLLNKMQGYNVPQMGRWLAYVIVQNSISCLVISLVWHNIRQRMIM